MGSPDRRAPIAFGRKWPVIYRIFLTIAAVLSLANDRLVFNGGARLHLLASCVASTQERLPLEAASITVQRGTCYSGDRIAFIAATKKSEATAAPMPSRWDLSTMNSSAIEKL